VVVSGDITLLLPDDEQVYAYVRRLDDVAMLVLVNVSGEPAVAAVPDASGWTGAELLLGGPDPTLPSVASDESGIGLQPWESRVLLRR
jgi:oligo-1,6-glucosidase